MGTAKRYARIALCLGLFGSAIAGPARCGSAVAQPSDRFVDPLDAPAVPVLSVVKLNREPFMAAARVGARLVAVGLRGLIIYSDDDGTTWRQAVVPVQSDLLAVYFPDLRHGWAVGHDGVILNTEDAGRTWIKQFDGRLAAAWVAIYRDRVAAGDQSQAPDLNEMTLNTQEGPDTPWLSVWFADARTGYVVGSFGMVARTDDGGRSWVPWLEHVQNEQFLNLNALAEVGGQLYIVGERGSVFRFDSATQRFLSCGTGYQGSLFGITGAKGDLYAFGLRGTVYRSEDDARSWQKIPGLGSATITAGRTLPDGTVVLADEAGMVHAGDLATAKFRLTALKAPIPATDLVMTPGGQLIFTGYQGLEVASGSATLAAPAKE